MAQLIRASGRQCLSCCLRVLLVFFLVSTFFLPKTASSATDAVEIERQVKAAYLYKFGSYVEWPENVFPSITSPLIVGVVGADLLADELARIALGRTIGGRPVTVRKLRADEVLTGVNVLFIGRSSASRLVDILAAVKGHPLLTVTESEDALAAGSMINLVVVDGKVRFEASPKAAGVSNLNISARLLAAAYKIAAGTS
ncbi:MAG: YfiR family protein [Pseudomonadota bacterium]